MSDREKELLDKVLNVCKTWHWRMGRGQIDMPIETGLDEIETALDENLLATPEPPARPTPFADESLDKRHEAENYVVPAPAPPTHDFDPDSFVSNVHSLDNKTLFDNCIEMQNAFARVVTTSWPSVMRCAWMVGVYEREAKHRTERWIVR